MKLRERQHTGSGTDAVSARETAHRRLAGEAAAEGMVLLRNQDQVLPLAPGSWIALYGAGAVETVRGGSGSGDVNARDSVSVWEGLEEAGYRLTSREWLSAYRQLYQEARQKWKEEVLAAMERPEYQNNFFRAYTETIFVPPSGVPISEEKAARDGAETALFVLSRRAGEQVDRREIPGDYYLLPEERALLEQLSRTYRHIVLVINAGGLVDLAFTEEIPGIHAIVYMVQGGQEGGRALADLLSGRVTPSGKLTDTWALSYEDYPSAAFFGRRYQDGWTAEYREDIYVGYRYFDTFEIPVRYGFGFGLSYTSFSLQMGSLSLENGRVAAEVTVTNTGREFAGKEVVQIYVSCPQGRLPKEYRRLVCFGKTGLLRPGESQTLRLSFSPDMLASFEEERAAWILEPGTYGIWVGNSLEQAELAGSLILEQEEVRERCRHICPRQKEIPFLQPDTDRIRKRQEEWTRKTEGLPALTLPAGREQAGRPDPGTLPEEEDPAEEIARSLTEEQLITMVTGVVRGAQGELGNAGQSVPGAAGETAGILEQEPWQVAGIVLADGPAGLRLNPCYRVVDGKVDLGSIRNSMENGLFAEPAEEQGTPYFQYCTAIPVGTLLAQTWDLPLMRRVGRMIGEEMEEFAITLWLAPGMNIHRNPLCGRNFEYYSEDPLLSGIMAAAITQGVQEIPGCGTTIKHFACNNQEDRRKGSDSILSERALREIYLRGFEIAVKTAQPMGMMTSYNMINGVHAANSYDLCTKVAREEWGFAGLIMTDWTTTTTTTAGICTASGCIRAGNDLIMPGAEEDHRDIRQALRDGTLEVESLRQCARNVIRICLCSNRYEEAQPYASLCPPAAAPVQAE